MFPLSLPIFPPSCFLLPHLSLCLSEACFSCVKPSLASCLAAPWAGELSLCLERTGEHVWQNLPTFSLAHFFTMPFALWDPKSNHLSRFVPCTLLYTISAAFTYLLSVLAPPIDSFSEMAPHCMRIHLASSVLSAIWIYGVIFKCGI